MTALLAAGATAEAGLLIRATLLFGITWAAATALKKAGASAAARHSAWLLGIAALLALPVLWGLVPSLGLPILPADTATGAVATPPPALARLAPILAGPTPPHAPEYWGWNAMLLTAYMLGAVALLLRLAMGRRMLARLWREAEPAREAAWENLLFRISREMRLSCRVELRIAPGPAMPMTWGTLTPKVLLPAEASAWSFERRRLVLLHELAHVVRRDSLSRSVASLACALYWFHPGVWFAARQLRLEQEHAADDRVLAGGASAQAYARSLLHLAWRAGEGLQPAQAASMGGMRQLERRLVSIVKPARRDRPSAAFLSSSALIASVATLVVAAGVPVSPSSALTNPLRAETAGIASPAGTRSALSLSEDGSANKRPTRADTVSATQDGLWDGSATESALAARPHKDGGPSEAGQSQEKGRAPRGRIVSREDELKGRDGAGNGRDRRLVSASAQPLLHYDWRLPPERGHPVASADTGNSGMFEGGGAATAASARADRLILPTPLDSALVNRNDRPKGSSIGLRLVPTGTDSRLPSTRGRMMLSWSMNTVGRQ